MAGLNKFLSLSIGRLSLIVCHIETGHDIRLELCCRTLPQLCLSGILATRYTNRPTNATNSEVIGLDVDECGDMISIYFLVKALII
jgi:hypothetical protein